MTTAEVSTLESVLRRWGRYIVGAIFVVAGLHAGILLWSFKVRNDIDNLKVAVAKNETTLTERAGVVAEFKEFKAAAAVEQTHIARMLAEIRDSLTRIQDRLDRQAEARSNPGSGTEPARN